MAQICSDYFPRHLSRPTITLELMYMYITHIYLIIANANKLYIIVYVI